ADIDTLALHDALPILAQLEGHDRRVVTDDVVATARLALPRLAFVERLVAGGVEPLGEGGGGVEGGGGCLEEIDQTLGELCAHDGLRTTVAAVYRICSSLRAAPGLR